jgi:hypothetical protein
MTEGASGKAIASLVIGVVSLVTMCFPLGVVAVIVGRSEMADIQRGISSPEGEGYAKAGVILGWATFGLFVLGAFTFLLVLLFIR